MSTTTIAGIGLAVVAIGHAVMNFASGGMSAMVSGIVPDLMAVLGAFGLYKAADAK